MIKLLKTTTFLLCTAVAVPAMAQDCEILLSNHPLDWDDRYDGKTGEEIGLDFAIRSQNPNDLEAAVFINHALAMLGREGDLHGQYNMGVFFRDGMGVPQDTKMATCWFRLAANQGDVQAQLNLAGLYAGEYDIPKDIVSAHMWSVIAASSGDEGAKDLMMNIQRFMGFNQMNIGWERARVCMASNYQDCD